MEGTINCYDKNKNFGFITTIAGDSIFFHKSDIKDTKLLEVEFKVMKTRKGLVATKIERRKPHFQLNKQGGTKMEETETPVEAEATSEDSVEVETPVDTEPEAEAPVEDADTEVEAE